MIIEGLHEKNISTEKYPFRLAVNDAENFNYPLHWHSAVELLYVLENNYCVNLNGVEIFLNERDILFIAGGDIHSFHTQNNKGRRFFIQFDFSKLEAFGDISTLKPYLSHSVSISPTSDTEFHKALEDQILKIINACNEKALACDLYVNARVYDILVILSRALYNYQHYHNASCLYIRL